MATSETQICKWDNCGRVATVMRHEYLCEGHNMVAEANYDTWGKFGISHEEWLSRMANAAMWFQENPA